LAILYPRYVLLLLSIHVSLAYPFLIKTKTKTKTISDFGTCLLSIRDERVSILHIASEWGFNSVRKLAIQRLFILSLVNPIERITVGRRYGVFEQLLDAYVTICTHKQGLSVDEQTAPGLQEAMKIYTLREAFARRELAPGDLKNVIRRACCPKVPAVGAENRSARTPDASPRIERTGPPVFGAPSLPAPATPLLALSERSSAVSNSFDGRWTRSELSALTSSASPFVFGTTAATLSGKAPCPVTSTHETNTYGVITRRKTREKAPDRDVGKKSGTGSPGANLKKRVRSD
jgi:hypothetical protein